MTIGCTADSGGGGVSRMVGRAAGRLIREVQPSNRQKRLERSGIRKDGYVIMSVTQFAMLDLLPESS